MFWYADLPGQRLLDHGKLLAVHGVLFYIKMLMKNHKNALLL